MSSSGNKFLASKLILRVASFSLALLLFLDLLVPIRTNPRLEQGLLSKRRHLDNSYVGSRETLNEYATVTTHLNHLSLNQYTPSHFSSLIRPEVRFVTAAGSEKVFASGVNFSKNTHFFVFLSLKLLKFSEIKGVKSMAENLAV